MLKFLQQLEPNESRRQFLQVVALGAAGFMVGCSSGPAPAPGGTASPAASSNELQELNAFVKIGSDDTVTVVVKHAEFGQGSSTGLTALVAEELDADWAQMRWEFAPADVTRYANTLMGVQGTGGSSAIANSWDQLRRAGATARALLVQAAAELWNVPASEIQVSSGTVSHAGGKSSGFGRLAASAARQQPPADVKLKDPKEFKLIGKPLRRLDRVEKSTGQAMFTVDKTLPGMRVAVVAHPPMFGAKIAHVEKEKALAVSGVHEVVEIPRGVAVIARDFWSAVKGRAALQIEWSFEQAENRGTPELLRDYRKLAAQPGKAARHDGDAVRALAASSGRKLDLEYEFPYLAHASMEPMGCVVEPTEDGATLYYGAQLPTVDQQNAAKVLGLAPEKVKIQSLFGGGSFGRRAVPDSDYVVECCSILAAASEKTPLKLMWDRTDDLRGGRYRPMSVHRVRASVTPEGKAEALLHRVVVQSFLADSPFAMMVKDGIDSISVEGSASSAYNIPNFRVELHMAKAGVPTLWWRSVGHTYNAFVMETLIDAMAHAAGKDPVAFRRELLPPKHRLRGVLEEVVARAGAAPKGPGKGRGLAVHESFRSYVAQIVDVSVRDGQVHIDRIHCAVDCGIAVNPDLVRAQMESGIVYGLSAITGEQVTLKDGEVEQANFDTYRPIRMPDVPPIDVSIVASAEPPTGTGEPGTPPVGPALANAIFAATGKRITRLPLSLSL